MADDKQLLNQDDIERLLQQSTPAPVANDPSKAASPGGPALSPDQIEAMLSQSLGGAPGGGGKSGGAADEGNRPSSREEAQGRASGGGSGTATMQQSAKDGGPSSVWVGEGDLAQEDLDFLLSQAERALASIDAAPDKEPPPGVMAFRLEELSGAPASTEIATLDLIRDVELDLRIELGRTHMYLEDVLKLRRGSVVPLDKMAGDPVDIFVNGRLIARGEVLVLNDNFCVRVAELIAGTTPAG